MPSMSTGGAAMKARMKQLAAVRRVGIISTPNQPMYRRLLVLVLQSLKAPQRWPWAGARVVVVMAG
jgi:hypothetical protein